MGQSLEEGTLFCRETMKRNNLHAVIIGDPFNNTLGLIRSLGEAHVDITLLLVGKGDRLFVSRSRYLRKSQIFHLDNVEDCLPILQKIADGANDQVLICTNDGAAQFIDSHEPELSQSYITPMRGGRLGNMMNKDAQCLLAQKCGFTIPRSFIYKRGDQFPEGVEYPLLLKPANSTHGEKSDIHICTNYNEVETSLQQASSCPLFIVQEYIEKEYEINLIGVRTEHGVYVPGGIKKIRHYPTIYSPCSFGLFQSIDKFHIDTTPIVKFMNMVGYYGPFSVELLHKKDKNYFMEFNFRHDGLAYAATASGVNLPALLFDDRKDPKLHVKDTYMMDLSTDYCHVKDGTLSKKQWWRDFMRTGCQLNFNRKDPMPTVCYYVNKLKSCLFR